MRNAARWFVVALVVATVTLGPRQEPALAAEGAPADSLAHPSFAWSATYATRYSFQGLDYSQGRPVLQSQVSGSSHGLTLTVWANGDQTRRELNELDISLQRDWSLERVSGALGYVHLRYPHRDWEPTHEVFADLAFEGPLEPSLSVHWDVAAGSGRYWTLGLDHTIPWRGASMALAGRLDIQDHYYGLTGIPALETHISVTTLWGRISVQPALVRLWTWSNGDFRDAQAVHGGWVASLQISPR